MKHLAVLCFLFFCTLQTFSQQEYFIYLQTDNSQPFYIRINKNVYSSTAAGYLILPKQADSAVSITIGFANNISPEQVFNLPASHKDAGYTLKNDAGKGWGLLNLQTQAVIESSSHEEKKNTEITGSKRTDAFSSLMANAVNDTSVLYIVARPPKQVAAQVIANENRKRDSVAAARKDQLQKDSVLLAKRLQEKKDSALVVKIPVKPVKDSSATAKHLPKGKENPVTKIKRNNSDTGAVKKKPAPAITQVVKTASVKADTILTVGTGQPKKDTIIMMGKPAARPQPALAKNRKERKDTIILMTGKATTGNSLTAKNATVKKETSTLPQGRRDSTQVLKKEILQAPEEKRDALLNNKDAVQIENVPVKKDSVVTVAKTPNDTHQKVSPNDPTPPTPQQKDTVAIIPQKRLRPLVNKVAELLTDTSYIAVFVDESKEKFDTIRISIPFNEYAAYSKPAKPVAKQVDSIAKAATDSPLDVTKNTSTTISTVSKNDTPANKVSKDTTLMMPVRTDKLTVASADTFNTKADSITNGKRLRDTAPVINQTPAAIIAKKDSLTANPVREPAVVPAQKDSLLTTADSVKTMRTPAKPLFLNSDCKEVAQDSDIDKLRIKMLLVTSDEDRITLAKKLFRQKCFLVQQVRALSELFKSDEGKYKWFDAAYPYVSDTGNFSSLAEQLKDDYYLNRFKAMLRH